MDRIKQSFFYPLVGLLLGAVLALLVGLLWFEVVLPVVVVGGAVGLIAGAAWQRAVQKFE
ncbi:MAG: hypothetical protein R3272_16075 [Candidatus Promineifilaceae bacterium]|nr:hypothetical protein [Candidatus Promineifilaceae bacterium]